MKIGGVNSTKVHAPEWKVIVRFDNATFDGVNTLRYSLSGYYQESLPVSSLIFVIVSVVGCPGDSHNVKSIPTGK
jgi:hypothetical protein